MDVKRSLQNSTKARARHTVRSYERLSRKPVFSFLLASPRPGRQPVIGAPRPYCPIELLRSTFLGFRKLEPIVRSQVETSANPQLHLTVASVSFRERCAKPIHCVWPFFPLFFFFSSLFFQFIPLSFSFFQVGRRLPAFYECSVLY